MEGSPSPRCPTGTRTTQRTNRKQPLWLSDGRGSTLRLKELLEEAERLPALKIKRSGADWRRTRRRSRKSLLLFSFLKPRQQQSHSELRERSGWGEEKKKVWFEWADWIKPNREERMFQTASGELTAMDETWVSTYLPLIHRIINASNDLPVCRNQLPNPRSNPDVKMTLCRNVSIRNLKKEMFFNWLFVHEEEVCRKRTEGTDRSSTSVRKWKEGRFCESSAVSDAQTLSRLPPEILLSVWALRRMKYIHFYFYLAVFFLSFWKHVFSSFQLLSVPVRGLASQTGFRKKSAQTSSQPPLLKHTMLTAAFVPLFMPLKHWASFFFSVVFCCREETQMVP